MLTSFTAINHRNLARFDSEENRDLPAPKKRVRFSMLPHWIGARNAR